jgi:hypothetical protein
MEDFKPFGRSEAVLRITEEDEQLLLKGGCTSEVHLHGDNVECVIYLRNQGYTDIRDDQCCVCYFQQYFEEVDDEIKEEETSSE